MTIGNAIVALSLSLIAQGCRATLPPGLSIEQACPVRVALPANVFENTGLVKPTFAPFDVAEVEVPIEGGFQVRRITDDRLIAPRLQRMATWRGGFRRYSLISGMPETAWRGVGIAVNSNTYEVRPGRYQILMRYRTPGIPGICVASTDVFTLEATSIWITTN